MNLRLKLILFALLSFSVTSCSITTNLNKDESVLIKNSVIIEDSKSDQFYNLIDYVRPIPNKRSMGIFLIKPYLYANNQPITDSITGEIISDSKIRQWLRKRGEKQVLYDTLDLIYSTNQLKSVLRQRGYFDARVIPEVVPHREQVVAVNYHVYTDLPYYIRDISYQVGITEYKRIVMQDTANSLIKIGMKYNEETLIQEKNRILSSIRNEGYYHASTSIITIEVDTTNSRILRNKKGFPTVSINIKLNFDRIQDAKTKNKHQYKYTFDEVYIYTNYDPRYETGTVMMDTTLITDTREYGDPTHYYYITPVMINKKGKLVHINDFRYSVINNSIYTKKGHPYSQEAYNHTYKRLKNLNNFNIINISFEEHVSDSDSLLKRGKINSIYKLTLSKPWGIKPQLEVRTDLSSFSCTYFDRNLFKGAEYLNINGFVNVLYYNWLNNLLGKEVGETKVYGEYGGSISLNLPYFLIINTPRDDYKKEYRTSVRLGGSYSQLFSRLMLFSSLSYYWGAPSTLFHTFSPIDISTIDSRETRNITLISSYPESYQRKFDKFILLSVKYGFSYTHSNDSKKRKLFITTLFESTGLTLSTINYFVDKENKWKLFDQFNYSAFERVDFTIRYLKIISNKSSFASRLHIGFAIPIYNSAVIPFEKSFFAGGANSMRGWTFRQLGPGSYHSDSYLEKTGDIKLEFNLEYRGTIYKILKYGVFADFGNIWLSTPYDGMENAHFAFDRFYKEIAMAVGAGIRLDFSSIVLRLDYGLPLYDPTVGNANSRWINKEWISNKTWHWAQGLQFGIKHAF